MHIHVYIYIYVYHVGNKPSWHIYAHGPHGYVGASARVAPLRKYNDFLSITFSVVQPVHLHQHTCNGVICLAWGDLLVNDMFKQVLKRLSLPRRHGTPMMAHL